jgi:hypothetical protein
LLIKRTSPLSPSPSSLESLSQNDIPRKKEATVSGESAALENARQASRQLNDLLGPGKASGEGLKFSSRRFLSQVPAVLFGQATRRAQSSEGILDSVAAPLRMDSDR